MNFIENVVSIKMCLAKIFDQLCSLYF